MIKTGKNDAMQGGEQTRQLFQEIIERLSYFENLPSNTADNDNRAKRREQAAACFNSWALPEHMR